MIISLVGFQQEKSSRIEHVRMSADDSGLLVVTAHKRDGDIALYIIANGSPVRVQTRDLLWEEWRAVIPDGVSAWGVRPSDNFVSRLNSVPQLIVDLLAGESLNMKCESCDADLHNTERYTFDLSVTVSRDGKANAKDVVSVTVCKVCAQKKADWFVQNVK